MLKKFQILFNFVLVVLLGFSSGCGESAKPGSIGENPGGSSATGTSAPMADEWFQEQGVQRGLDFVLENFDERKYWIIETVSGGIGVLDFDGDGWMDLYMVQAGDLKDSSNSAAGNRLYRNQGDGSFVDVTESAGVGDQGFGITCVCADYDSDGDTDIYITNYGANTLYRNNGDGTFTDVSKAAGVADSSWGNGGVFFDADGDGDLDLFLVNYLVWSPERERECSNGTGTPDYCGPTSYDAPDRDRFFINDGQGRFAESSKAWGVGELGDGLAVVAADFNLDGRLDIYVANDGMANHLWLNRGGERFEQVAGALGCAYNQNGKAEASMGIDVFDLEGDGDYDLICAHLRGESNTLYRNDGGQFEDVTNRLGLGASSLRYTGFGIGFVDFDHDGLRDIYVANGDVQRPSTPFLASKPYAQPNMLYRGKENGKFELHPASGAAGLPVNSSRGAAFGDFDNDGDLDIVVSDINDRPKLYINKIGDGQPSVTFRVLDKKGVVALNARVDIIAGGLKQTRLVKRIYSYACSNDPRVHFGLGENRLEYITVTWLDGTRETFPSKMGKFAVLQQGKGVSLKK